MKKKLSLINYYSEIVNNQNGQVLLLAITTVGIVLFSTLLLTGGSQVYYQNTNHSFEAEKTIALAEAGIDKAVASLNVTGGNYNGEAETVLEGGSYSVVITDKGPSTKLIEATGYIPSKSDPKIKRTIQVEVSKGIGTAFNYGLQVGDGGLEIDKDSSIQGSVYSNGNVIMMQNTTVEGDVYVAGGTSPSADQEADCDGLNCSDFIFGKSVGSNSQLDVAQSFSPSSTAVINKVALKLKKVGTPPNLTIRILGNSAGNKPNKGQVLATGTLTANLVTESYGFIEVSFSSPPTLTVNQTYWIMIDTSNSSSNYWNWSLDLAQGYNGGTSAWSPNWNASSPVWNTINGDLGFKTYMGGVATYIEGADGVQIEGDAHANTLKNLDIIGDAYYQIAENIDADQYYPGSPDPASQSMPISQANIDDWKSQATTAGIYTGNITNCPGTLAAGKYVGSITVPEDCSITVGSPIWVTEDLHMNRDAKLKLETSFDASSGVFMVENFITLDKENSIDGSGTAGSYLILISNFNSKDDLQQRDAINVSKEGNEGVLYSNLGTIYLAKENRITSLTGWKLKIAKESTVTYDEGLAGTFFSSGPSGAFSVVKGTYKVK